jgi:hypothetical protein
LLIASAARADSNQPQQPESRSAAKTADANQTTPRPAVGGQQETPTDQNQREAEIDADWWMVRLTGVLAVIGAVQVWVFGLQASRLRQTIEKMDEIAAGQTQDMRDSISEGAKAAVAMDKVAGFLKINAEKIVESVEINKELAERQKLIGELQTRAFLAVNFIGVVPQSNETGYRFEPRIQLVGSGLTPAYKVSHRTAANVLDYPLRDDFNFSFDISADPSKDSVAMLGPRNSFILSAPLPRIYSEAEIEEFKNAVAKRIFIWGKVTYEDAFGIPRFLNFCQSVVWMADKTSTLGFNAPRHNDAN